eukprot:403375500
MSKKDKHIIMDLLIKSLSIAVSRPTTLKIDWARGAKKVSTKEFNFNFGDQNELIKIEVNERFQIQTCIFHNDQHQKYETKPSTLAVVDILGNNLGQSGFDLAQYAPQLEDEKYQRDPNQKLRLPLNLNLFSNGISQSAELEIIILLGYQKPQQIERQNTSPDQKSKLQKQQLELTFQRKKQEIESFNQKLTQEIMFYDMKLRGQQDDMEQILHSSETQIIKLSEEERFYQSQIDQMEKQTEKLNLEYQEIKEAMSKKKNKEGNNQDNQVLQQIDEADSVIKKKKQEVEYIRDLVSQISQSNIDIENEIHKIVNEPVKVVHNTQHDHDEYLKVKAEYELLLSQDQTRYQFDRFDDFE